MATSLRELKQRRNSVATTMKITKAMELIAASRVTKAQQRARNADEYTRELVRAVSTVAAYTREDHRLTQIKEHSKRAAVLVINSDRGLAGGYPANVMRASEGLLKHLAEGGLETDIYTVGRRALDYFNFRHVPIKQSWQGFSEDPHYANAHDIGRVLIDQIMKDTEAGGVDEIHVVYTRFLSLVSQRTELVRLLPLQVVRDQEETAHAGDDVVSDNAEIAPPYNFEPDAETVLDALLPLYVIDRIKYMLRESAASELAARQQAMHSATDNAQQLIDTLTRQANTARQAEITQEITEIVGGASALSESTQEM
ncbi:F0F1 ATP synthase subunit gamma [Propionibacterium freudenreichii]|uniref:ATP synthase gamma chain n=1 Tax=Propionibacterium freudenreichii TaxID=1744 RepID=A0A0A8PEW7_9ACTN|nr:F0F1 ATP synthase subunit gamma [Propionibacterium freudenreichii]MDN5962395.1 F0F1 ATP synthase subunit gamma [Propionibacterium sp.]ARO11911.1 F0F1 ATP synthase subunit gamma [Propionibacterium freudenreichii]AWY95871.1 ATP synthase gamma chain [Propionibacterium freudenreichii]MCT3001624.1 F0F1 ATP synthase subunit gamma [Propionibacterium freudenreichii]MCT3014527.1 F0F1 ATP synthase subunit gamma [Propionibacterium freudenreichii]